MDQDHTLNSEEFERWKIVAAESGMLPEEIAAAARVRHRLLAAVWICRESLPDAGPGEIIKVFEAIASEVFPPAEWPDYNPAP